MLECICVEFAVVCCCVTVFGCVSMLVVSLMLLNVVCFLSLGVYGCIVSLCSGCVGCCTFCLICDAWSCKCWYIGSMFVCRLL